MTSDILSKVKLAIRRTHSKLDDDLQADINACLQDMQRGGIPSPDPQDPLILAAIKMYCRSTTADDPANGAAYLQRYEQMRDGMALSGLYGHSTKEENNE